MADLTRDPRTSIDPAINTPGREGLTGTAPAPVGGVRHAFDSSSDAPPSVMRSGGAGRGAGVASPAATWSRTRMRRPSGDSIEVGEDTWIDFRLRPRPRDSRSV
jgi:hypothetical protein